MASILLLGVEEGIVKRTLHFRTALLISLLPISVLHAADSKVVEPAPIPTQIILAKRVFIANAGGDEPGITEPLFSGGADRSYNQFYAAMKSAGRYELVGAPAEADLLFEIRFTVVPDKRPTGGILGNSGSGETYDALFRLEIRDPETTALLWAFNEHMEWATLKRNRDRNFDEASDRIVSDVLALMARAAAGTPQSKPLFELHVR